MAFLIRSFSLGFFPQEFLYIVSYFSWPGTYFIEKNVYLQNTQKHKANI